MYKMLVIIMAVVLLLAGCSAKKPITDEWTKYDLPVINKLDNKQFIHVMYYDGMFRSLQYAGLSQLVIDPTYYETNEITRGDVVFYESGATEEEIKDGNQSGYYISRIIALPGETVTVMKGQIYIDDRKLETFYGKEYYSSGFIDGTDEAHTIDKAVNIPEDHYFLAGDVWWRSGFDEQVSADRIRGKVVGWTGKQERNP